MPLNFIYEKRGETVETDEVMLQLDELHNKVEELIERCRSLDGENVELRNRLSSLEAELERKTESENQFSRQKAQIRSKIDDLLQRLNNASEQRPAEE